MRRRRIAQRYLSIPRLSWSTNAKKPYSPENKGLWGAFDKSRKLAREWLDPATPKERAEQMVLHQGEPTEAFEWFRVNPGVGNVRNQGQGLIQRVQ